MNVCKLTGCSEPVHGRGLCNTHYRRWDRTGEVTTPHKSLTPEERFAAQTRPDDATGCWAWTGVRDAGGYGRFKIKQRAVSAHRFSYENFVGPILEGFVIDHLCRNRNCVNPEHLEAVTFRENLLRGNGMAGRWARRTECKRGHTFDPPNGYIDYRGRRACRTCDALPSAERKKAVGASGVQVE